MDRPSLNLKDYLVEQEVAAQRRGLIVAQNHPRIDSLLPLLVAQMDIESLRAFDAQYPDVMQQQIVLSSLTRRFNLPPVKSFLEFLDEYDQVYATFRSLRRPNITNEDLELLLTKAARQGKLDIILEGLQLLRPRLTGAAGRMDFTRQVRELIEKLVKQGFPSEALLLFGEYYQLFSHEEDYYDEDSFMGGAIYNEEPISDILHLSALETGDSIFYYQTLDLVNEKLKLLGNEKLLLKDQLPGLKEYAIQLKNAFYDRDLSAYKQVLRPLHRILRGIVAFHPVLVLLSLGSSSEIRLDFIERVVETFPDYRLDYRLLTPSIRAGIQRGIEEIKLEGNEDLLDTLSELGFDVQ